MVTAIFCSRYYPRLTFHQETSIALPLTSSLDKPTIGYEAACVATSRETTMNRATSSTQLLETKRRTEEEFAVSLRYVGKG